MDTIATRPSVRALRSPCAIVSLAGAAILVLASSFPAAAAWLGVSVQEISPALAEAMELREASGALVADVVPGSPADRCGIRARDVIVKVDGAAVESSNDLVDRLSEKQSGDVVALHIWRGAQPIDLEARLAEPPSGRRLRPRTGEGAAEPQRSAPARPAPFGPQIGVDVYPMNKDLAHALGVDRAGGLLVLRVRDGSPAADAGFQAGDVILRMNDREVQEPSDIRETLQSIPHGGTWEAQVLRDRATKTLHGRVELDWPSRRSLSPTPAPLLRDRDRMTNWAHRQRRQLDREVRELRERLEDLERRLRERDHR